MKLTTSYWIAIRHVGDSSWVVEAKELPAHEIIKLFMGIIKDVSLATEIVVSIARTKEAAEQRVNGTKARITDLDLEAELDANLAKLLKDMED